MKIIIIIPAYNEEEYLGKTLEEIKSVMDFYKYKDYEIHVQNDGSTDMTAEVAELYGAKVFTNPSNLGLARTFKEECKNARDADIIIHTDADGQYKAQYIPLLIEKMREGNDLVLGSRFLGEERYSGSILKRFLNPLFSRLMSFIVKKKITDFTTGFRAFNQKVASLEIINTFTYTHEQIVRAIKSGLKIKEIPIETNPTRKSKLFKNPLDYAIKSFVNILRVYRDFDPIKFFGSIGLFVMGFGLVIWIYMLINLLITGHTGYLNLSLLSYFLVGQGFLILILAFIADMNRKG